MITVEEKLRRLQPFIPEARLKKLWTAYTLEENFRAKKEIETLIDSLIMQKTGIGYENQILLPPPLQEQASGEIRIGEVSYCGKNLFPFGLTKQELLKHVGLFGQTGSGKTNACINIIKQLAKQNIPFLIFDWKRNYRDLLRQANLDEFIEITAYTVGRNTSPFYFNPKIPPPKTDLHVWQKKLMEIIEKAYLLGPGATDVLMDAMSYETFGEMKEYLEKQRRRGREMLWHMSGKRTLNSICYPGINEVVNTDQNTPLQAILDENVVIELDALSDTDKAFIIGSMLLWIYHYRMSQPERETLKHVIIIEEAHHLLLKTDKKEDITDVIMREIRELGEGIIILDQHPHKISVSALGNCNTKFGFTTTLSQDICALSSSMLINKDQRQYFGMLDTGQAIIKTGRTPFPFLINIPKADIKKGFVTDEMIQEQMSKLSKFSAHKGGLPGQNSSFHRDYGLETHSPLTPAEAIMLEDIAIDPLLGVEKRYKKLGLNPRVGNELIISLESKGLICPLRLNHVKFIEITASGMEAIDKNGLQKPKGIARGGIEHNYWLEEIKRWFSKYNAIVTTEKDDIDLVAKIGETIFAVQVETGKSDIKKNVQTLAAFKADLKFMVATNDLALTKINNALRTANQKSSIQSMPSKDLITKIQSILPFN